MSHTDPGAALNGVRTGNICSGCNKGIRTGDPLHAYATLYEGDGWVLRRIWCDECGDTAIESGTFGADEATLSAIFWNHRLVGVQITDRSRPEDGERV